MARTVEVPEGHTALTPADMDRFSVGPDKKLYLDNERVATKSLFERPMARVLAVVTAGVTILGGAAVLADTVLTMNDRYCWWPSAYSHEAQCNAPPTQNPSTPDAAGEYVEARRQPLVVGSVRQGLTKPRRARSRPAHLLTRRAGACVIDGSRHEVWDDK